MRNVVFWSPLVVSSALIGLHAIGSYLSFLALEHANSLWIFWASSLWVLLTLGCQSAWAFDLYRVTGRSAKSSAAPFWGPLVGLASLLTVTGIFIAAPVSPRTIGGLSTVGLLIGFALAFLFAASLWKAASSLVETEQGHEIARHTVVGTFLLVLYLPLGVWLLHKRVKRLRR